MDLAKQRLVLLVAFGAMAFCGAQSLSAGELVVLTAVTAGKEGLTKAGPSGGAPAPVVKAESADDPLAKNLQREALVGTTKFVLDLDALAQRRAGAKQAMPTYLLVSNESGGFARRGFWLTGENHQLTWVNDPYVNMVVDQGSLKDGSFEEEFAHEMGHVILRRTIAKYPDGLSRIPHSSLAVTDFPTAFDEGFAIHFQGVARYLTENANLKAVDKGLDYQPFVPYWQSNLDRGMRIRGMRENLFVQRQLPVTLKVGDATAQFDLTHFKSGQQMMASEGVIATLFYQLMLLPGDPEKQRMERYNSLLLSLRTLGRQKLSSESPLFINLVQAHVQRLPAVRAQWLGTFLNVTYGATATPSIVQAMSELSAQGQEGNQEAFVAALKQQRAMLADLTRRVTGNTKLLDDAIGPELWIAFQDDERIQSLNLNTAEATSLMQLLHLDAVAVDVLLADRWANGPFKSVDDFATRRNVSALLRQTLVAGHELAAKLGGHARP